MGVVEVFSSPRTSGETVAQETLSIGTEVSETSGFQPRVEDPFVTTDANVAWIGSRNIRRPVVGRTFHGELPGNQIIITTYVGSYAEDFVLFRVAQMHEGATGVEGVITEVVSKKYAETLIFSG